jgi:hypothetical protein
VTTDHESQRQYVVLLELLTQPSRPTIRAAGTVLRGMGSLSAGATPETDTGEGHLAPVTSTRSTSWDVLSGVTAVRTSSWNSDASAIAGASTDYAKTIAKWGGSALIVVEIINKASETVLMWIDAGGS